jgi:hypothetical protein
MMPKGKRTLDDNEFVQVAKQQQAERNNKFKITKHSR